MQVGEAVVRDALHLPVRFAGGAAGGVGLHMVEIGVGVGLIDAREGPKAFSEKRQPQWANPA